MKNLGMYGSFENELKIKNHSALRYIGTVRHASIFAKKNGTPVRYSFFVMVRYVGTVRLFCNGSGMVRWYAV